MENPIKKEMDDQFRTVQDVDARGRVLKVRKPAALKRFKFINMLGKDADSDRYMSMVAPLIYLCAIDEDDMIPLSTRRELDALIQRLGDEGLEKLEEIVQREFFPEGINSNESDEKNSIKE